MKSDDLDATTLEQEFYRLDTGLSGEQKLKRLLSDYHFKSASLILYNFECINSKQNSYYCCSTHCSITSTNFFATGINCLNDLLAIPIWR